MQRTASALSWLLGAVSSQSMNVSEDKDFTASLASYSHVWSLLLEKKKYLSLSIHRISSHCCTLLRRVWLAFSKPSIRQLKPIVRCSSRVSFSLSFNPRNAACFFGVSREHTTAHYRLWENHFWPSLYFSQAKWEKQVTAATTTLPRVHEHQQIKALNLPIVVVPSFSSNKCSLSVKMW